MMPRCRIEIGLVEFDLTGQEPVVKSKNRAGQVSSSPNVSHKIAIAGAFARPAMFKKRSQGNFGLIAANEEIPRKRTSSAESACGARAVTSMSKLKTHLSLPSTELTR